MHFDGHSVWEPLCLIAVCAQTLVIHHQTDFHTLHLLLGSGKTMVLSGCTSKLGAIEVRIALNANEDLLQKSPLPYCMETYLFYCMV